MSTMPALLSKYPEQFVSAVKKRQHYKVEKILSETQTSLDILDKVWARNGTSFTPLMYAASIGDTKMAKFLIMYGADVNKTNESRKTALFCASHNGHTETVLALLHNKASVNKSCKDGWTPLHIAAYHGDINTIVALTEYNANINLRNNTGNTPLQKAVGQGHTATVLKLLQLGADASLVKYNVNAQQQAKQKHFETAQVIRQYTNNAMTVVEKPTIPSKYQLTIQPYLHTPEGEHIMSEKTEDEDDSDDTSMIFDATLVSSSTEEKVSVNQVESLMSEKTEDDADSMYDDTSMIRNDNIVSSPTDIKAAASREEQMLDSSLPKLGEYKFTNAPIWYKEESTIFLHQYKSTSNNQPYGAVGVPYKKIEDPSQYLDLSGCVMPPGVNNYPCRPILTKIEGRPTEREVNSMSSKIGFEWIQLALLLGLSHKDTQHIQMAFHYDGRRLVFEMLMLWRYRVQEMIEAERCSRLRRALQDINLNDVANSI